MMQRDTKQAQDAPKDAFAAPMGTPAEPLEATEPAFSESMSEPAKVGSWAQAAPGISADGTPLGGHLFMVATPIGCPGDLSPRARRILEGCDLVLCEDTRRTLLLCRGLGLRLKQADSFHDHNEQEKAPRVLERLRHGDSVALVSDAGTPVMADPGYRLVQAARKEGFPVHPIPGPSAPTAALCAAGIPAIPWTFLGFLPRDAAGRKKLFETFRQVPTTLAFFERKDRLAETLAEAASILGPRQGCICRELTKTHEEFILFRLEDTASALSGTLLGEITVLIGPPETTARTEETEVARLLAEESAKGGRPRDVARRVQARVTGWSTGEIYALSAGTTDGQGRKNGEEFRR